MPFIKEYRVPVPVTIEEYHVAQLYTVIHASKEVTDGKCAVEILENVPFEDKVMGKGQYTHKIYHLAERMPKLVRAVAPASALKLEERAWNAFPHCKTILSNPFLGDRFELSIETMHLPDRGETENALNLSPEELLERQVQVIDIAVDQLTGTDEEANETYNPEAFVSQKTNRGPLADDWIHTAQPMMCAYKLVRAKFQVFGLQTRIESYIESAQWSLFLRFHKMLFTLIDEWYGLTMDDIRRMENALKDELDQKLDGFGLETRDQKISRALDASPASSRSPASGEDLPSRDKLEREENIDKIELAPNTAAE